MRRLICRVFGHKTMEMYLERRYLIHQVATCAYCKRCKAEGYLI